MNSIERFMNTIERKPVDRPACWLGSPDIKAQPALMKEFGVSNMHELKLAVGDDVYMVDVPYQSETASAIFAAFDWYKNGEVSTTERTLTTPGFFADAEDPEEVDTFDWPDPEKYISVEECKRRVDMAPANKIVLGMLWSAHFQDTCAAFGMENALVNMISNPEMYEAVDAKIMEFYLKANRIFFEATKHRLNAVLIGDDMGSQRGLMLSPDMIRRFVLPGTRKLVEQAHSYGMKVIFHSCGSIFDIIPDLIDAGVDAIHPIQALAANMDAENLKKHFEGKVSFCGGVDTQDLLVHKSPEEVKAEVQRLKKLFPTGLIISPSHEAIMEDIPPKNIRALFEAVAE